MEKKKVLVLLVAFIFFIGVRLYMNNQAETALEQDTKSYLAEIGYDVEMDIEKVGIVNIGEKETKEAAVVTFNDEPQVDYFFTYEEGSSEIIQIDAVNKGANQQPEFETYDGPALKIAVVGELPEITEKQITVEQVSFNDLTRSVVDTYDAVFIMEENLAEAAESSRASIYLNSSDPFFFMGAKSHIPFTREDTEYGDTWEWKPGTSYATGILQEEDGSMDSWGFGLYNDKESEANVADVYSRVFEIIEGL